MVDDGSLTQRSSSRQPTSSHDLPAEVHLKYITLLCTYKPDGVLPFLLGSASYPLDETLDVVQKAGLSEAVAYLKEHTGDSKGALDVRPSLCVCVYIIASTCSCFLVHYRCCARRWIPRLSI